MRECSKINEVPGDLYGFTGNTGLSCSGVERSSWRLLASGEQ